MVIVRGADAEAAGIARELGYLVACHPPSEDRHRAFVRADFTYPEDQFLQRNQEIVRCSVTLIVAPRTAQEQVRSGTWSTVRYARKTGKPVVILARTVAKACRFCGVIQGAPNERPECLYPNAKNYQHDFIHYGYVTDRILTQGEE